MKYTIIIDNTFINHDNTFDNYDITFPYSL